MTSSFEVGGKSPGNPILTTDSGAPNAWAAVAGTCTYDNAHVKVGSLSGKIVNTSTLRWDTTTETDAYLRFYAYLTALPSGGTGWAELASLRRWDDGGSMSIWLDQNGKIGHWQIGQVGQWTSSNAISLNAWFRIEAHLHCDTGGAGSLETRVFVTDPESVTPSESHVTSGLSTLSDSSRAYFGDFVGDNVTVWYDDVGWSNITWLGPTGSSGPPGVGVAYRPHRNISDVRLRR